VFARANQSKGPCETLYTQYVLTASLHFEPNRIESQSRMAKYISFGFINYFEGLVATKISKF
jgi:hypothetical protein